MRLRALFFLLLALPAACSGGSAAVDGAASGRFQTAPAKPSRAASSRPSAPSNVTLPKNLPPASMFVGPASWRTGPSRYCLDGECASLSPPRPQAIEGPAGAAAFFTLSAAPKAARLEVVVPGSATPTVVPLNPGTAIAWQATLPPGTYPLTLVATYPQAEVSWPFSLRIVPAKSR